MFLREWKCLCPRQHEEGFISYLNETGVKETASTQGCLGYKILRRRLGDDVELSFLTYWKSLRSMKEYAGENIYKAVLYPEDDAFDIKPDLEVKVYELLQSE